MVSNIKFYNLLWLKSGLLFVILFLVQFLALVVCVEKMSGTGIAAMMCILPVLPQYLLLSAFPGWSGNLGLELIFLIVGIHFILGALIGFVYQKKKIKELQKINGQSNSSIF